MKKKASKPRIYVELIAVWGNGDADSSIKIGRRRWKQIQEGAEYSTSAWSWYEGRRSSVDWSFANGKVSVHGGGARDCVLGEPVETLIVQEVSSG